MEPKAPAESRFLCGYCSGVWCAVVLFQGAQLQVVDICGAHAHHLLEKAHQMLL